MKFSTSLKVAGLILALFATQGATCDPRQSNARLLGYKLISDERTIDPATGEVVLISHWEYSDGLKTTTKKRLAPGTEERQWERPPRPEPRVVD
jgi:hypothetical protein